MNEWIAAVTTSRDYNQLWGLWPTCKGLSRTICTTIKHVITAKASKYIMFQKLQLFALQIQMIKLQ